MLQPRCPNSHGASAPTLCSVLLKGYDERGFIWYTNYDSTKVSD